MIRQVHHTRARTRHSILCIQAVELAVCRLAQLLPPTVDLSAPCSSEQQQQAAQLLRSIRSLESESAVHNTPLLSSRLQALQQAYKFIKCANHLTYSSIDQAAALSSSSCVGVGTGTGGEQAVVSGDWFGLINGGSAPDLVPYSSYGALDPNTPYGTLDGLLPPLWGSSNLPLQQQPAAQVEMDVKVDPQV
jgi:hypothetical protein